MIKFSDLLDTRKCYEMIKLHRWPEGVICPHCDSSAISLRSEHHRHAGKNRYQCKNCHRRFDDLSFFVCIFRASSTVKSLGSLPLFNELKHF